MSDLPYISIAPFAEAVDRLGGKTAVASKLRTRDWHDVPLAFRDRAFFSAGVDDLNTVQAMQDKLTEWANVFDADGERAFMDKSKFISEMRQALGAEPGDSGSLTDITSASRLGLIYDFQTQDAAEFGRWKIAQDPELLDAFPAQEFVRIESRIHPRQNWPERWAEAGGEIYGGRMIALKNSPVWTNLSVFGRPWPPFDFNSGMGIEDIDRAEAIDLGVIEPDEQPAPQDDDFNKNLAASIAGLDVEKLDLLKSWFGDQIRIADGQAEWND